MKNPTLIKLMIPTLWLCVALYLISIFFDLLNKADTMGNFLAFLGVVLIAYLSVKYQLGLKLISNQLKQKNDEKK